MAEFKDGEFFGEMALLGDQVRTASVKASTPTTVYRLTRRDVLAVAEFEPQIKQ
jgi:CRP-like cAMP-binding protein